MKAEIRLAASAALAVIGAMTAAGCQEKKQPVALHATAVGEVLPGSVSDAMLPVDTVRSQPPLAPKVEPSGDKSDQTHVQTRSVPSNPAETGPVVEPPAAATPEPPAADQ